MSDTIAPNAPATADSVLEQLGLKLDRERNLSDLTNPALARYNLGIANWATMDPAAVAITGGTINGTTIGASSPAYGRFATLIATGLLTASAGLSVTGAVSGAGFTALFASPPVAIGSVTPAAATVTDLTVTGSITGASFDALFGSPPPIGSTAANTVAATDLSASGTVSGAGFVARLASPGPIGNGTPGSGAFTTLSASGGVSGAGITALFASPPAIGGDAPAAAAFTALSATGTVSGAGFTARFASPGPIGSSVASTGAFTDLAASGTVSGQGFTDYMTAQFASPPIIGSVAPNGASFTTLAASGAVSGAGFAARFASPGPIGSVAASTGAFTTLAISSTISGAGVTALFGSPPAIGSVAPAAGAFTTLGSTGTATLGSASAAYWSIAGTGSYPTITAAGSNTDIDARVLGKGTGYLNSTKLYIGSTGVRPGIDARTTVYMRTSTTYSGAGYSSFFVGGLYGGTATGTTELMSFLADDSVAGSLTAFRVHDVLHTGATGARTAMSVGLTIAEPVAAGAITNFLVAMGSIVRISATMGGIPGDPSGNPFAGNDIAVLANGSGGHVNSLVGREVDTAIASDVRVIYHAGVTSILHRDGTSGATHEQRGWVEDYAFGIGSAANNYSTVGWAVGLGIGSSVGWAMDDDSRVIAALPVGAAFEPYSRPYTLASVIDMTIVDVNQAIAISKNMNIDGAGNGGFQVASGVTVQARDGIFAKTAAVDSVTILQPQGGGLYTASGQPDVEFDAPPGGGTAATAQITEHAAEQVSTMSNGGTGYAVNQVLTQTGGTFTQAAQVTVLRVDGSGKIRELLVSRPGVYTVLPIGEQSFTGGTGTDLAASLFYTATAIEVTDGGTPYPEFPPPVARYANGTVARPPVLVVEMTATQVPLHLNNGKLNVTGIPTSAAGLGSGDVWRNGNVMTVVP